jgi:hypothetical protein
VLARNIGRLERYTSFTNTGVLEDENRYLEDVYPADVEYGGTGTYGSDARSHLTEASPLLTAENIRRVHKSWHSYGTPASRSVLNPPSNLVMTRFLQAAFSKSYFVVIRRHPVAVSIGVWLDWRYNLRRSTLNVPKVVSSLHQTVLASQPIFK